MNVVNNSSAISNAEEKTDTYVKIAGNLKKNLHRLYFSKNDHSEDLPQSSSTSEENLAVRYWEKDQIFFNTLTTVVKITNDTIELLSGSTQGKETKSFHRISNIRKSEGPLVKLIDLNTPPVQDKFQRKYIAPGKCLKETPAVAYFEKDQIIYNNLTTVIKIANDFIELFSTSTESKETKNLIDFSTPPVQDKLQRKYIPPREILKEPLIISEEKPALTYFEKDQIIYNNLTTMIKITNDFIELLSPSTSSKEMKSLIDFSTPPGHGKLQRKCIPSREILKEPLTLEEKSTVTYLEKDQIIYNNLTTVIKIANDSIELLSSSTQSKEMKSLIDVNTPVQSKLQRKYMTPRKIILKEPLTLSNSKIPQTKRLGIPKHMERCTRSTINLTQPKYTSSPKLNLNPSVTQNGVSHKKKLLKSSTYNILRSRSEQPSNLSSCKKKSSSEANLTITLEK